MVLLVEECIESLTAARRVVVGTVFVTIDLVHRYGPNFVFETTDLLSDSFTLLTSRYVGSSNTLLSPGTDEANFLFTPVTLQFYVNIFYKTIFCFNTTAIDNYEVAHNIFKCLLTIILT